MTQAALRVLATLNDRPPANTGDAVRRSHQGPAPGTPRYDSEHHLNESGPIATNDRPVVADDVGPCSFQGLGQGRRQGRGTAGHRCNEVGLLLMKRWMVIEVSVLVVGCGEGSVIRHCMPS
jgi:hypothetical protein